MFAAYRPLTELLLAAGQIRGRKKLQKIVFIAQSLGYPFGESFQMHMWGPYSETLALKLKEMADWGFAQESVLPGPGGNTHYVYEPGPAAARIAEPLEPDLHMLVALLNARDATLLEGAATSLLLLQQGVPTVQVPERLTRLKPDKFADEGRLEAVNRLLDQLESARRSV